MRAIVFAALILAACAAPSGSVVAEPAAHTGSSSVLAQRIRADLDRLDRELRVEGVAAAGVGETADLGDGLTLRPLGVVEDSRCPGDVTCVWAGRLRIRVSVSGADVEMILGQPSQTSQGVVIFAVAKPSPWASWPNELGPKPAYRFGFRRG